jgi:hypothetical protein
VIAVTHCCARQSTFGDPFAAPDPNNALKIRQKLIPCGNRQARHFFLDFGRIRQFNPSHKA